MSNNKKKIEPWRIIVFVMAVVSIIFMWVKKTLPRYTQRCHLRKCQVDGGVLWIL